MIECLLVGYLVEEFFGEIVMGSEVEVGLPRWSCMETRGRELFRESDGS